jgi:putative membrane protein
MKLLIKLGLSTLAVLALNYLLDGIRAPELVTATKVAVVLGVLNTIVRPILVFLTIPITILTLGIFLLVINGAMVMLCSKLISGFEVNGWLWAIVFSALLSIIQWILYKIFIPKEKKD